MFKLGELEKYIKENGHNLDDIGFVLIGISSLITLYLLGYKYINKNKGRERFLYEFKKEKELKRKKIFFYIIFSVLCITIIWERFEFTHKVNNAGYTVIPMPN